MFLINSQKSLGANGFEKTGYVAKLNAYVIVSGTKYGDFMRNVRGMGSLAGSTDIRSVKIINKQIYDNITKGVQEKGRRHETNFFGHQETRNGVIVKRNAQYNEIPEFMR